ncbi:MAG TPA: tRNA pseudouridine(55) synthase TruB [Vicinamibacterales bacterium]
MDGLLVVDKPAGPTSHDVVNRMRRVLGERRIGHAGTLDPGATGVLVLLVGRATRLARFLNGSDKTYDAVVRLGQRTDSGDADGTPVGPPHTGALPSPNHVERALEPFRGAFLQQPPAFSAKHVDGTRSHRIARSARRAGTAIAEQSRPDPVAVTAHDITVVAIDGADVSLRVACSAGFYIRSLADDLGERLGTGAHLRSLRRTASGDFGLDRALPLDEIERDPGRAAAATLPMADAVPGLPAVTLTPEGVRRALQGRDLDAGRVDWGAKASAERDGRMRYVRLLDPAGELIGVAEPARVPGFLHPFVVLG